MLILSLLISIPIGLAAGIYLAEFAPNNKLIEVVRICVEGLSSVPSIIFGLFGIALFVEYFEIGLTILGAAVSLAFLNLPVLSRVTEEAVRAVPTELRNGSFALGATHLQNDSAGRASRCAERNHDRHLSPQAGFWGKCRYYSDRGCIHVRRDVGFQSVVARRNAGGASMVYPVRSYCAGCGADCPEIHSRADFVVLVINILFRVPLWFNSRKNQM